jgi:hypothetical protein
VNDPELLAWADRMKDALEAIVEGLEEYADRDAASTLSVEDVVSIARRGLNPDLWTRITP